MKKIIITFFACIIASLSFGQANTYFHNRIDTTIFVVADTVGHGANHYFATNTSADFNVKQYVNGDAVNIFFKKGVTGTATLALITKTGTLSSKTIKKPNGQNLVNGDIKDSTSLLLTFFGTYWRCDPIGNMGSTPTVTITGAGTTTVTSSGVGSASPSYTVTSVGDGISQWITATSPTTAITYTAGSVAIGTMTVNASLDVKGAGTTSTTLTAVFNNSTGTNNELIIRDDGYIGMGTAIPESPLHIKKSLISADGHDFINIEQTAGGVDSCAANVEFIGKGMVVETGIEANKDFFVWNEDTNRYDFFSTRKGNFEIGVTNGSNVDLYKLWVNSSKSSDFIISAKNNTVLAALGYNSSGGYLGLNKPDGSVALIKLDNSGNSYFNSGYNLGINETSPTFALTVNSTSTNSGIQIGNNGTYMGFLYSRTDDGATLTLTGNDGSTIKTAFNNHFLSYDYINNGKNVGIGTTSPSLAKLQVAGTVAIVDGSQGFGKIFTSDINGLGSWQNPDNGSFIDTITQTSAGATSVNKMKFRVTEFADGVTIVNDTAITISHTGTYNIQFSVQANKSDGGSDDIDIWLRHNGTNLSYTNGRQTISNVGGSDVVGWNILVQATAGDYFTWVWSSADTAMQLLAQSGLTSPVRASIPSTALSVNKIK